MLYLQCSQTACGLIYSQSFVDLSKKVTAQSDNTYNIWPKDPKKLHALFHTMPGLIAITAVVVKLSFHILFTFKLNDFSIVVISN